MKRLFKIVICLVVLGSILYPWRKEIQNWASPFFSLKIKQATFAIDLLKQKLVDTPPCAQPITYALGTFDARFGISKKYFLSALTDAEAIWEKPSGKDLFTYASDVGTLKINLVYDYRQQATSKLASLGITVKDDRASYDALKKKYDGLQAQYVQLNTAYGTRALAFSEKNKVYQQQVEYWNTQHGAPQKEFDQLQAERVALENESLALKVKQEQINAMVTEINALSVVLNRLAGTLNLTAQQYNAIGASRGESFEEGVYKSSAEGQLIDIYEFSSRAKLVRVLAHELGHALSLEHVEDPKAIMYRLNQGTNSSLTPTDLAALKTQCRIQ